jgi:predicted nuclease of predicted toxin-antitoxin system
VHETVQKILLDQNIPQPISEWLRRKLPLWVVRHVNELGFQGKTDEFLYLWAQAEKAIIVTYDEDFADSRFYQLGNHHGVIRLRVWPTTIEQTQDAFMRLISDVPPIQWQGCLIIIDNNKIRVRKIRSAPLHP